MPISDKIRERLTNESQKIFTSGSYPSRSKLEECYFTFRSKFGPEIIKNLDGRSLLYTLHDISDRNSLVYWLEYKNDVEFPAIFGSISGGSALKYGIFRRKETGAWTVGIPRRPIEISEDDAIIVARKHRDQFIEGCRILEAFSGGTDDQEYALLQRQMDQVAPDLSNMAWAHKYFSLIFPQKLDDYHNPDYQKFHLIKLLQTPPIGDGRFLNAGRFIALANELDISVNLLTKSINDIDGEPYRYWSIGAHHGDTGENWWDDMREGSFIAIGWSKLGDLSWVQYSQELKDKLRDLVKAQYPTSHPTAASQDTQKLFSFAATIEVRDIVLVGNGDNVFGIGQVTGGYDYTAGSDFPHRRPVKWLSFEPWKLPETEVHQSAFYQIRKITNQIEVEKKLLEPVLVPPPSQPLPLKSKSGIKPGDDAFQIPLLTGVPGRIQSILERKKQIIIYGPPGTGKTYWAKLTANDLAAFAYFGKPYKDLSDPEKLVLTDKVRNCTFHPAYGYEDFLEGYRPEQKNGQLIFDRRDGIFKRLCDDAAKDSGHPYFLIVDEINRGDIPRIFGELLTLLEKDKRGSSVTLPLSGETFMVPPNVFLIGTMNTADRSIALLDTALRRRFGFYELMPDINILSQARMRDFPLGPWLDALNKRILQFIGHDARNLQIGHAYFLDDGKPVSDHHIFIRILDEDVFPLLEEYCYEDYEALEKILGSSLVDKANQRIKRELLDPSLWDDLKVTLLALNPELVTSTAVVASEADQPEEETEENIEDAATS